ncbi:hypothetical protein ACFQ07_31490 [Actinomadura adrarensis]|uniref:Uncharacterized protein n=1 Tax=Actinomadura adrarensis TaxID=1819600 RepID=A0ABW3CQG9_9ACTN
MLDHYWRCLIGGTIFTLAGITGVAGSLLTREPLSMPAVIMCLAAGLIFLRARKLADDRQVFWHIIGGLALIGLMCGYSALLDL